MSLPFFHTGCIKCGIHLTAVTSSESICGHCIKVSPSIDRLFCAFHYQFPIDKWLPDLKFQQQASLANWFADQLSNRVRVKRPQITHESIISFVPIPLHSERLRKRGFNQALLITKRLTKQFKNAQCLPLLQKHKAIDAQSGLGLKQRLKNIKGAFSLNQNTPVPEKVILIDDVYTSGATLNEAARTLKKAGCKQVEAWVIAHAPLEHAFVELNEVELL